MRGLGRALRLREGEGPLLGVLAGFLFLTVAADTFLSAAKNSLFLSVFPARLIPHSMVAAAVVTAVVAVAYTGVMSRFRRRRLAIGLLLLVAGSLGVAFLAFRADPRSAFAIYLWATAVQMVALTHAWDYAGDLLTGRQAKRLLPLIAVGGSLAAVVAGSSVGWVASAVSPEGLLWVAGGAELLSLAFLFRVREPAAGDAGPGDGDMGAVHGFLVRSGRGLRSLAGTPLLRLLAVSVVVLVVVQTLVDFQWKLVVQDRFDREQIAVAYGVLEATIGAGSLVLQVVASRILFPILGISAAWVLQAGAVTVAAAAVATVGGFWPVAALRWVDEVLRESIEKSAQQISLLPFPPRTKNAAFTTLEGVLRPAAQAAGALLALALIAHAGLLAWLTAGLAAVAVLLMTRHRKRYLRALEDALSRHQVDLQALGAGRLTVDRGVLGILDRFMEDEDPTVVVFALSLLRHLPGPEGGTRAVALLGHPVPEVRMEAATVLGSLVPDLGRGAVSHLLDRLDEEKDVRVMATLLDAASREAPVEPERVEPFATHPAPEVRRAALVALGRHGLDGIQGRVKALVEGTPEERSIAMAVVGELRDVRFLPEVADAVVGDAVRPAALAALGAFGEAALPALDRLIQRQDLPLPVRRTLITTLAAIHDPEAIEILLRLVRDDELGPAALTSLRRLRTAGRMGPVKRGTLRHLLRSEVERAARYALVGEALGAGVAGSPPAFVVAEMNELRIRHLHRVLAVLTLGYDAGGIGKVEGNLFSRDAGRRSNALEYLEGSLAQEDAALVVPLAEWQPADPIEPLTALTVDSHRATARPLETLAADDRWWPRALAELAETGGTDVPSKTDDRGTDMIPTIEKVMLLKGSELFRSFPGDELAGIAQLAGERHCEGGETVFDQGDPGDAYYLVVRGAVSIIRDGTELAVLGSREGFGEMAILDQDTRSATARATEPTTLLVIDRDSFDQLVERNPAIARGIYRVLTQRLRNTLARVAASG